MFAKCLPVPVSLVAVVLTIMTNLMFTMYHLYMRRKSEYQTRLLNILFCHLAVTLQACSLLNLATVLSQLGNIIQMNIFHVTPMAMTRTALCFLPTLSTGLKEWVL